MLQLHLIDDTAERRSTAVGVIDSMLRTPIDGIDIVPRVSLRSLAPEEADFHGTADLIIIGPGIAESRSPFIARLRNSRPDTPLLAMISRESDVLFLIEQLARAGVDDVITGSTHAAEFLKRIIILARRNRVSSSSRLIVVDSGKGGLGATSLCAAVAELLVERGKKVLAIDLDSDTQDLARFLQARPFVNESLESLLGQSRPMNEEFVTQAVTRVWSDVETFFCMAPPAQPESDPWEANLRVSLGLFEVLDRLFDAIVVDASSARGSFLRALYRIADDVLFVVSADPAALYAGAQRLCRGIEAMAHDGRMTLIQSSLHGGGELSRAVLEREMGAVAAVRPQAWISAPLPFCAAARCWPGSGLTPFSAGGTRLRRVFSEIEARLEQREELVRERLSFRATLGSFRDRTRNLMRSFAARYGRFRRDDREPNVPPPAGELSWTPAVSRPPALITEEALIAPPQFT